MVSIIGHSHVKKNLILLGCIMFGLTLPVFALEDTGQRETEEVAPRQGLTTAEITEKVRSGIVYVPNDPFEREKVKRVILGLADPEREKILKQYLVVAEHYQLESRTTEKVFKRENSQKAAFQFAGLVLECADNYPQLGKQAREIMKECKPAGS